MSAVIAWLIGSRVGRFVAGAAALAMVVGIAALKLFAAGAAAERAKQTKARLDAVAQRRKVDAEVDALGPADVDRRLDRWLRRDKG